MLKALSLLILLGAPLVSADMMAVELTSCEPTVVAGVSTAEEGVVLEFPNLACMRFDYSQMRTFVAGLPSAADLKALAAEQSPTLAVEYLGSWNGVASAKMSVVDGKFQASMYMNIDCSGPPAAEIKPTGSSACGKFTMLPETTTPIELGDLKVTRTGPSWIQYPTLYKLPEKYIEGDVVATKLRAGLESDGACTDSSEEDSSEEADISATQKNGACVAHKIEEVEDDGSLGEVDVTQDLNSVLPENMYLKATCYDGIVRMQGGLDDQCRAGIFEMPKLPTVGFEVPTVDLVWGKCVSTFVKIHTYTPDLTNSLRIVFPLKVHIESCQFLTDGRSNSTPQLVPLLPADALATLPPQTEPASMATTEDSDSSPVGVIVGVVVGVLVVAACLVLLFIRSRRQAMAFGTHGKGPTGDSSTSSPSQPHAENEYGKLAF